MGEEYIEAEARRGAVAMNQVFKKIAILEHCRPYDQDECARPASHPRPPGLPPEDEVSDEELTGPGARYSEDLGTSKVATSAEWGPSLEAQAESASD